MDAGSISRITEVVLRSLRTDRMDRLVEAIQHVRNASSEEQLRETSSRMMFTGPLRLHARHGCHIREFRGSAYNGGIMYPSITPKRGETMSMAVVLDLESLIIPQPECPVLDNHDDSPDGIIGHTTMLAVRKSDYTLPVVGIIYTRKRRSQKILAAADGGHKWQLSIGAHKGRMEKVEPGRSIRVNNRTFNGPIHVARNTELTDVSFVAVGGDDTTYATIHANRNR